jgi:hypothetical protein
LYSRCVGGAKNCFVLGSTETLEVVAAKMEGQTLREKERQRRTDTEGQNGEDKRGFESDHFFFLLVFLTSIQAFSAALLAYSATSNLFWTLS